MNRPRVTWPAPPSRVKQDQPVQIQEASAADTADTVVEVKEVETEREISAKKYSYHAKKKLEYSEPAESESVIEYTPEPAPEPEPEPEPIACEVPKKESHKKKPGREKMSGKIFLAHSYVPRQYYQKAFTPDDALRKGTLFPELWGVYPIPK